MDINKLYIRKAGIADIPDLQDLIKGLAAYEKRPQDMTGTKEQLHYWLFEKKIATALSIITVILCAVLAAFHQMWAAVSIGSGLILSAALQFPCLFQKKSP